MPPRSVTTGAAGTQGRGLQRQVRLRLSAAPDPAAGGGAAAPDSPASLPASGSSSRRPDRAPFPCAPRACSCCPARIRRRVDDDRHRHALACQMLEFVHRTCPSAASRSTQVMKSGSRHQVGTAEATIAVVTATVICVGRLARRKTRVAPSQVAVTSSSAFAAHTTPWR